MPPVSDEVKEDRFEESKVYYRASSGSANMYKFFLFFNPKLSDLKPYMAQARGAPTFDDFGIADLVGKNDCLWVSLSFINL